MQLQAHTCPMFTPVGSLSDNGGTSCGNCLHFNGKHIENTGREICNRYDELVEWVKAIDT